MQYTNRHGLPSGIVAAVTNDPYVGGGDISVTRLIKPPQIVRLEKEHADELSVDVADRIWSLLGQSVHSVLERAYPEGRGLAEERLYGVIDGVTLSGQFDVLEDETLTDFKVTSVWAAMSEDKSDWEQQLNCLRYLAHLKLNETRDRRYVVTKLQIVAILRDWTKHKAGMGDYPSHQVQVIPLKVWDLNETRDWIAARLADHAAPTPRACTADEMWMRPGVHALMKKGRKTAVKLYQSASAAAGAAKESKDLYVIERPAEFVRCDNYCDVNKWCPQYKARHAEAAF